LIIVPFEEQFHPELFWENRKNQKARANGQQKYAERIQNILGETKKRAQSQKNNMRNNIVIAQIVNI